MKRKTIITVSVLSIVICFFCYKCSEHKIKKSTAIKFEIIDKKPVIAKDTMRYLSFPSMVKINENHILMAYRDAYSEPNVISHGYKGDTYLMHYTDGKWSSPDLLYEHEGEQIEEMAGDLSMLNDGTIIIASRQWNNDYDGIPHESYIAKSTDGGRTFSPRKVLKFENLLNWLAPYGKIVELENGDLLMGIYGVKPDDKRTSSACLISKDRGDTWKFLSWVAEYNSVPNVNFNEIFILLLPDKSLFALMRTNGVFYSTYSFDNGKSWEQPKKTFKGLACAGLILTSGEILITYRGTRDSNTPKRKGGIAGLPKKGHLYNYRISPDGGRTWTEEVEIDNGTAHMVGSYGMGDIIELKDGSVKVVYYTSDEDQAPWLEECLLVPAK